MVEEKKEKVEEKPEKISEDKVEEKPRESTSKDDIGATLTDKIRDNPWVVSTLILGIVTLILLIGDFGGSMTGATVGVASPDEVQGKVLSFVNSQVDTPVEIVETNFENGLYEIIILFEGREVPIYVTQDGENLVQGVTPIDLLMQQYQEQSQAQQPSSIPKSDKPVVELFVMTHCPYGTQAEKGIIPTLKALGATVNSKIRFVHYFMHDPEESETPRQVCIREEQSDKWYDYLTCFLEDGDSERCLTETKIDKVKMENCISSGKAEEYYNEDSTLSEGYGVTGSPSLIINGVRSNAGRDSASYLSGICAAFNNAPNVCSEELSTLAPSPGFGWEGTGVDSAAQC
ncbi:MAG: hypothetical protein ABIH59_03000 [archaeon]